MSGEGLVCIVDDDPDVREALGELLETVKLQAAVFASASDFLAARRPEGPCCLVLDVRLPELGGLEFQRLLAERNIQIPIIFITAHAEVPMSVRAMKAGAVEFLIKPIHDQEFLDAVQSALRMDALRREAEGEVAALRARHRSLTPREQQIMALLVAGRVNKQIAGDLAVSEVTIRLHRLQVMRKMGVDSLVELARIAEKIGGSLTP
jgi:FixJ family two-component response regulator